MRRVAVVEDDVRAVRKTCDEGERGPDGIFGEVGNDSEPGEERSLCRIEAGGGQALGKSLAFEVDGGKGERGRNGDFRGGEALALPRLGSGMIDFENADASGVRVAVGVGVEAGAEDDKLTDALLDGRS